MTVSIERAACDEKTFKEIMDSCLAGLKEYAIAPVNIEKTLSQGYAVLAAGMSFIARDEQGDVVGVLGMTETDFYYSDEKILINTVGPYVRPDMRFGIVGVRLMRAVRDLADERDQLAFVWVMHPSRQRKTAQSLFAQVAGYVPIGHVIAIRSAAKAA